MSAASAAAPQYPSVLRPASAPAPGINRLALALAGTSTGLLIYVVLSPKRYPPHYFDKQFITVDEWIQQGVGNFEYYCPEKGATFPPYKWLDRLPDLSQHNNHTADVLRRNPGLYDDLKRRATENGINLGKCIKTGIDNISAQVDEQVGVVAGDAESYSTFRELFDEIINRLHAYPKDGSQPHDFHSEKLTDARIDPLEKYVLSCTIRVVRSLKGFNLPPSLSFEDRREVERVIAAALAGLDGVSKGTYYPLPGSLSYTDTTLNKSEEARLKEEGILMSEPASTIVLSSGIGRHWPDGRGIFSNAQRNLYVWVNNGDHMEIFAKARGDDVKGSFERLMRMVGDLEKGLRGQECSFAHDDHLGYVSTCPSNLGTGLRISLEMKLPNLMDRPDFRDILGKLGLRMMVTEASTNVCSIENTHTMGVTEVQLTNDFMGSCTKLVGLEARLEEGIDVDDEVRAMFSDG
ncbi:Creatine kinase S-type, mitochondrial [Perkinsus olseni]|uniref:Creatine kinase S-type, mitochondrial n=1 Tax=Perkinsus olseni TaxID=32597 RepID=A0A7J6RCJ0_PEROL|nr:Creatine kinase S-type, mitochondrial [Perkinsus olseni]KAF4739506.1 Creatine kinase S-type, mitochondrial [Perkinsus olseni]